MCSAIWRAQDGQGYTAGHGELRNAAGGQKAGGVWGTPAAQTPWCLPKQHPTAHLDVLGTWCPFCPMGKVVGTTTVGLPSPGAWLTPCSSIPGQLHPSPLPASLAAALYVHPILIISRGVLYSSASSAKTLFSPFVLLIGFLRKGCGQRLPGMQQPEGSCEGGKRKHWKLPLETYLDPSASSQQVCSFIAQQSP